MRVTCLAVRLSHMQGLNPSPWISARTGKRARCLSIFCTRKRVPDGHERCSCSSGSCCYQIFDSLKPNTHRRRRRDETVGSRRVGVGGVYMNSRRLQTDSAMRTHNAADGRDPVYNSAANGIEVRYDVTYDTACL